MISWTGLAGPANLPKPIVDRLNAEVRKALAVPEVKSKLEAMGGDPRATTPEEMRALVSAAVRDLEEARRRGEPFDQLADSALRRAVRLGKPLQPVLPVG